MAVQQETCGLALAWMRRAICHAFTLEERSATLSNCLWRTVFYLCRRLQDALVFPHFGLDKHECHCLAACVSIAGIWQAECTAPVRAWLQSKEQVGHHYPVSITKNLSHGRMQAVLGLHAVDGVSNNHCMTLGAVA